MQFWIHLLEFGDSHIWRLECRLTCPRSEAEWGQPANTEDVAA